MSEDLELIPMDPPEVTATDDDTVPNLVYWRNSWGYYAYYGFLAQDGRYWGHGGMTPGVEKSAIYWPGVKFRGGMEFFGSHPIVEGLALNAGDTVVFNGTIFDPGYVVVPWRGRKAYLEAGRAEQAAKAA